jgi:SNF2 family DNA or RNA helicase
LHSSVRAVWGPAVTLVGVSLAEHSGLAAQRRISLTREGAFLRLAFPYSPDLVALARALPYSTFDGETKSWTCLLSAQALNALRAAHRRGDVDVDPDTLLAAGEEPDEVRPALLRQGTLRRPFIVHMAARDDNLYARLVAVPGARWEKTAAAVSYPAGASVALAELVDRGVVHDPERLLTPVGVSVAWDIRSGDFVLRGDERAASVFNAKFPQVDVVAAWKDKGLDVEFADELSSEIYRGELARRGPGVQPDGMQLDLYTYQQRDVAVALERSGLLNASSMGVGKTAMAIAVGYELAYNRREVPRSVVVVPASVRTQWRNEIVKFTGCPEDDVVVVEGDKKKRMAAYERAADPRVRWVIVHYQAVILPDDRKRLEGLVAGSLLVADEAHRIKNHQAKSTKVMNAFSRKAARRLALSGTPVENNPGEWYNVVNFVLPGVFGSPVDFLNRYSWPSRFGGYEGARNLPELRKRSGPLYVRHTLSQVAEHLPRQRVNTVVLEPRAEYAAALKRAHREARDEIAAARLAKAEKRRGEKILDGYDREEIETGAEMTAVGLLKLLCASPRLVAASDAPSAVALVEAGLLPDEDGPKLDEVRNMAAEMQANGERIVIFTASKRMANLTAERFDADGIRYVLYTGDTSSEDRDAAVVAFTTPGTDDEPGPTAFISTDAGAEGLNLGKCCSTLLNIDLPWTPGRLAQRNARVRRVDSDQDSFLVVNLVLAGTLELGILRMVEHKADLADAVLGETGGRRATTGRGGRNIFEAALQEWGDS